MELQHERRGSGSPLVLVHGLGGSRHSFDRIVPDLATQREVVLLDLPGFGGTPPLAGEPSVAALTDAVAGFLTDHDLTGADLVGSSLGARMVLEMARRGIGRHVVALDPGGFWNDRELRVFSASLRASVALVRGLRPALPTLLGNPVGRTALLAQFSARPWAVPAATAINEVAGLADAPGTDATLRALVDGPRQAGAPAATAPGRLVIGWGRRDLVTVPAQAARAAGRFPDARLHWFERCGHFPQWDAPAEATRVILEATVAA
ncbi:alpha/beta fold hydrolase [Pseudonocardia sp.]|uniref:alpha/beta fold hydrolase n=1 Tax=Pseudonocardia sp. TaxID=60912 RepID=UPI002632CFE5|nr:alpha/beta fold hydrolase [Pseudonocardia sp.]